MAAAADGHTILAPNTELAAALFDAVERNHQDAGREVWPTPRVRDFGLKELAGLTNLSTLDLAGTEATDAGLRELVDLKNLTSLNLVGTRTTDAGIAELQKALPNCKVER